MNDPAVIERLLTTPASWAVVGCSPDPSRDSHRIAALLQDLGHTVVPVNPEGGPHILGQAVYPTVARAARDHDIAVVDIFRRPSQAGHHVDEAIAIGAGAVWLQLGVIDDAAASRAADASARRDIEGAS